MGNFFKRYLLPGFIFQGVVIGGGYATGRELAEFFLPNGPYGGLWGLLVAALVWGSVMAVSFEVCRITQSYDYKSFFTQLLGPFWFLFEVLLVLLLLIVLSVVAAAAGEVLQDLFGLKRIVGTIVLFLAITVLVFYGSRAVEVFISGWSILLYLCYIGLVLLCCVYFPVEIKQTFVLESNASASKWAIDGVRYASYNLATVPMVLFCLHNISSKRQALGAGLFAGFIGIIPAVLLFIAMMSDYSNVISNPIPSTLLLKNLNIGWFSVVFQVVLLGALLQTGVGLIHSVNERISSTLESDGREMSKVLRSVVAVVMLTCSFVLATKFGIIELIAKGYGALAIGFMIVFVLPVLTIGVFKIFKT